MIQEAKSRCSSEQPEWWGGLECTINRVRDEYLDQLRETGHYQRPDDIEKISSLGFKKIRYPILWEKHQPEKDAVIDWSATAKQLAQLRKKNMEVIAGLMHHGSGPAYTQLDDPDFPEALAAYAGRVARQFPWIEYYTPVNEPLTTARFSGLYGFWYPHQNNSRSFMTMLLLQLKATVLSMQAIRKVNPIAKLVQTEDLTKVQCSPALRYQAEFENHRRWLTYDILCGKLVQGHPMWKFCIELNIDQELLNFFHAHPCPPDIIGCNYYVTSERFLDEQKENHPLFTHGTNGRHFYADVESVRVGKMLGLKKLLRETSERYNIPIAVTEIHMHCHREEQLRWLKESWEACCTLRKEGYNIVAMTVWALLGAYDWNSLLTQRNEKYEAGVFDVSQGEARQTALGKMVSVLSSRKTFVHPLLQQPGWWKRIGHSENGDPMFPGKPILITGKSGTLGNAFARICANRAIPYVLLSRQDMDICNEGSIHRALMNFSPWAVVNTAGFVKVEEAETLSDDCYRVNAIGAALLARQCHATGIPFLTFSSDLVFDGSKQEPYDERDLVNPINTYGKAKALGESMVLQECPGALVVRSSSFFGPWDKYNFVYDLLEKGNQGQVYNALSDVYVSPTYVPDLVNAALDLLIDDEQGIWHLANEGSISWSDFATAIARQAGLNESVVLPICYGDTQFKARRPLYSVLGTSRGMKLPPIENAIERYFIEKAV